MRFQIRLPILILVLAFCFASLVSAIAPDTSAMHPNTPLHHDQQPMRASTLPTEPEATPTSAMAELQGLEAASEAGSVDRPVAKMALMVVVGGVLFGMGMGL
ncbi:hypothetical protein P153DRAFT_386013 [Dothidotthia symphoricarpi CBS 119687]|uniref:Uncharacterized protein n=1 Tax=Dothidotthia symphoricarpi CBS 119687 TaxID=1392245 RepID=A0A6A6AAI3_9PLEO|nr:uncharacterized protein P153DRAFT_386013 [Dothidotthia symphoricarpi CBS 119687]KAF2128810.1 hypothetical protein P153DRAFT_386013 [Dothidotthia symphoricarpi CBS 119687]